MFHRRKVKWTSIQKRKTVDQWMVWIAYRPKTRCQVWIKCTTFWIIVKCGTFKHLYYLLIKFIDKKVCTISVNLKPTNDIYVNIKYLRVRGWLGRTGSERWTRYLFWKNKEKKSWQSYFFFRWNPSRFRSCTCKIRELRIYYNTPNNALEREMAQVFNTKN